MTWTQFWIIVQCDPDLGDMTLNQGNVTPLGHREHFCEVSSKFKLQL